MNKFLNDFLLTMSETQRQKLTELLEVQQQSKSIRSDEELKQELERLINTLNQRAGQPTFMPIKQEGKTNSATYNQNLDSIAFDLETLFRASNTIDQLLSDNQQLSRSLLSDIKKKLYAINAGVEKYKLLIKNSDAFIDGIYEQFNEPQYTETNESVLSLLRIDRYGQPRSNLYNAENVGNSLQLAGIQTTDQLKTNYGRSLATIEVRNRTGLEASNNQYKIENAIDGSPDTFWAETILVDDIIVQNIDDIWSHDYHDYPKDGAICEIEIKLNGMSTVSEIQFDPYCAYPLEIVAIHGYETLDSSGKMYELVSPNHENIYQRSQKSVNRMIFQFPSVEISKIRILLRQENYVKENFIVNVNDATNMELWDKMASDPQLIQDFKNPGETIAEFDKKNEITGWTVYLEKLKEWATIMRTGGLVEAAKKAMEIIKTGDYKNPLLLALRSISDDGLKQKVNDERSPEMSKDWKAVNKFAYLYGAYNISVYGRKYRSSSIYVTKPLPLSSNIAKISLETEEKHHNISIGPDEYDSKTNQPIASTARITDIEYYITYKKNPSPKDWIPILPTNKKYVEGELLLGDDIEGDLPELQGQKTINFSFRFPIISKETVTIRRNGIPMSPNMYIITDDGKHVGIKEEYYSPSSIYTADYKPVDDAYIIDITEENGVKPTQYIGENGETGETFASVNNDNTITLKHYPYIYRKEMYQYDQLNERYQENEKVLGADSLYYPIIVRVNGVEYQNITNYATQSYDPNRLLENGGKTFAQIGKTIIFGTPQDQSKLENITVDYYYITTDIRMKAIFRRNYTGNESITPALYSYQIKCKSFDQM